MYELVQTKYRYKRSQHLHQLHEIYINNLKKDMYACLCIHINYTTQHIIATRTGTGAVLI